MRKFFITTVVVLILALVAAGAYFLFYKKSEPVTLTADKQPKLTKLSDEAVISPVVAYDRSGFWYFNARGQMFRRSFADGKITEHAFSSLLSLKEAVWPPDGEDFIALTNDSKNYFDSKNNTYTKLPDNIQSFDWTPDGKRIVYVWKSGDNKSQSLMLANPDASGFKKIKDVFWPDLTVKVSPDGKNALLVRSNVQDINQIYKIDLQTGEISTLVGIGRNIDVKWVSATQFLYNQTVNAQYNIKLFDLTTGKSTDLVLSTTLGKIAVESTGKNIYASAIASGTETIWKINLETLIKQKVYDLDTTISPGKLILNGQNILIINNIDKKLYYLEQ
jgi:dipeptidyl aminopeptidase/acylaminoacyl peptidase